MTTTRTFVLTAFCVGLLAGPAFAMSKNCDGAGGEPTPTPSEQNLQDILDDLVVAGPPIDASTPSPIELFDAGSTGITAADASSDAVALYFGIYPEGDAQNLALLLSSGLPTDYVATVSFTDEGSIVYGFPQDRVSRSGFDGPFGFFVKIVNDDSPVFIFTEAALNGGVRALAYQGNGQTTIQLPGLQAGIFRPDQFILAFDADGDGVFGDMVVAIAGIDVPVPEPASALLIAASLLALVRLRRS
jgi:hypothetical protein